MPNWVVVLGAIAFVVTSLYTIWSKAIRPGAKVISEWERMLPVWRSATVALEDVPEAFGILKEIVYQVRNNSGSSLLDMMQKISQQVDEERRESHSMAVQLEADRQLAVRDREQLSRLLIEQDRTTQRLDRAIDVLTRIVMADRVVAENLLVAQGEVDQVAANLANAQNRADHAPTDPGAAADAASKPAP